MLKGKQDFQNTPDIFLIIDGLPSFFNTWAVLGNYHKDILTPSIFGGL